MVNIEKKKKINDKKKENQVSFKILHVLSCYSSLHWIWTSEFYERIKKKIF
jgi:hypothetical protein